MVEGERSSKAVLDYIDNRVKIDLDISSLSICNLGSSNRVLMGCRLPSVSQNKGETYTWQLLSSRLIECNNPFFLPTPHLEFLIISIITMSSEVHSTHFLFFNKFKVSLQLV